MACVLRMYSFLIFLFVLTSVYGCGQIQPGREKTINFTVTDFKLPAEMVYYENAMAKMTVATISTSKSEAETFVRRLIRQHVEDVLYEQGRSAFLSDNVISSILQQLSVEIVYDPLKCEFVITDPTMANPMAVNMMKTNCIIISGTVTNICTDAGNACTMAAMIPAKSKLVPPKYLSITGSLQTSNVVMANWSNQMWQSVLNRVLRSITSSSQVGSFFYGASIIIK